MEVLLITDRFGYNICCKEVTNIDWQEIREIVAGHFNRAPGCLDNLSGSWDVVEGNLEEIKKKTDLSDCHVAYHLGQRGCLCGHEECPHYDEQKEIK